jgi:hypothetical protein
LVHSKTGALHFKNVTAYHNYLAYIHIHHKTKHHKHPVVIAGKVHSVCHNCGSIYHKSHEHRKHHPINTKVSRDSNNLRSRTVGLGRPHIKFPNLRVKL